MMMGAKIIDYFDYTMNDRKTVLAASHRAAFSMTQLFKALTLKVTSIRNCSVCYYSTMGS